MGIECVACNECDRCGGDIIEVTELEKVGSCMYKFKEVMKCNKCGKIFDGQCL